MRLFRRFAAPSWRTSARFPAMLYSMLGFVAAGALSETSVSSPDQFDPILHQQLQLHDNSDLLVYVYAEHVKETGKSWCPDCVRAEPFVLAHAKGFNVISVPVERDKYKGNPLYPLRTHPLLQLKAVPQLYRIAINGEIVGVLVEEECWDEEKLRKFIDG